MYPFFLKASPHFNAPLVQLLKQVSEVKKRAINFVDVGAAIGDTVLLIKERCADSVRNIVCVEGDSEFFQLLSENVRHFENVKCVRALLAREQMNIPSLIKHHRGTASATGSGMSRAIPLDGVDALKDFEVDVLKIDVDGFDGEVLAGAKSVLTNHSPAVIFEWHPELIESVSNDVAVGFESLMEAGYDTFVWFRNDGTFSHFDNLRDPTTLKLLREYLLSVSPKTGQHYDVVAIKSNAMDPLKLARLDYAF
jgi:FkbM family methyltransferase